MATTTHPMLRRLLTTVAVALVVVASLTAPALAQDGGSATTTTAHRLPGTTLEADQRDDGSTNAAAWVIGSGIAAIVAIAVGGTILKRYTDAG